MDLVPIGVAAERLGMAPSALRYYDERGLVPATQREHGRRMYGPEELRRLAFVKIAHGLGIRLDVAATILDAADASWRDVVREQIDDLDALIEHARGTRDFLTHALGCPSPHPLECATMVGALDDVAAGGSVESLRPS